MFYPYHRRPCGPEKEGGPIHAPMWVDLGNLPGKTNQDQKVTCWRIGRGDWEEKLPRARKQLSGRQGEGALWGVTTAWVRGFTLEGRKGLTG